MATRKSKNSTIFRHSSVKSTNKVEVRYAISI